MVKKRRTSYDHSCHSASSSTPLTTITITSPPPPHPNLLCPGDREEGEVEMKKKGSMVLPVNTLLPDGTEVVVDVLTDNRQVYRICIILRGVGWPSG